MLYQLYDWQRAALEPWRLMAQAGNEIYGHPDSPLSYLPGSRNVAAAFDLMTRLTQRYERPAFGIRSVRSDGVDYAVSEVYDVEKPFCRLLHFRKMGAPKQPKVIVFAPLSGHFATLCRDTVKTLLADHDVWITDWIDAKEIPITQGPFHFDDYVAYVREFLTFTGRDTHAISVCQPTVPVMAAVSLMAANGEPTPRSLTMMGGPIDTRRSPTEVNTFAKKHTLSWFEAKVIQRVPMRYPGFMRRVYPGFLQFAGFVAMNPDRHMESHVQYYQHLVAGDGESADAHRRFYDEYNAVMDLPAEYYLETVDRVFHKHSLAEGKLVVGGERVRPEAIKSSALFTIEGELDDISGNGQTEAAQGLTKGIPAKMKQHFEAKGVGHYGIFSGRKFRELIYPRIREFIREA
ncbi:MAG TPA: polyhydroxyalkanoate depolymerase [Usitatibacter sp.]|jgi:poly(3-hydroxybutyrate) depolymerase|nr:polyhydroxyalkanoate depolymerase [Usitatibacter sp.]